ncbi:hypothetical protein KVV02_005013 [Mortierella alpina]|uniref:DDE-1 domain-containing protein n=1 Tax=Mortierella alpina TaxID=64518 RepID=A0A9P8CTW6_MORAP|nr:hypothetical protein KVV02_005013 [Mortierella alpina]
MPAPRVAKTKAQTKGKGKTVPANAIPRTEITTTTTVTTTTVVDAPPNPSTRPTAKRVANVRRKELDSPQESTPLAPEKKKRKTISLALKAEFLDDYQSGRALDPRLSAASVGRWEKYNFNRSDVNRIIRAEENIRSKVQKLGARNSMKINRIYPRKIEVVEAIIFQDFKREIDATMVPDPISFSNGWLLRFKRSRGIRMQTGHGEEGEVDMVANSPKFATIASLLLRFKPSDIYNCDETGLYLKVLSNKTLSYKKVHGRKMCKEARVSILLCCNADGSHKLMPFVLCKNRPNGLTAETLAALRCHFKNGYMNTSLFNEWLLELDDAMGKEGRRITLLMDNVPGHAREDGEGAIVLKNIELIRLPPKTTSVAQPLDAGIIRSFKVNYSRNMIRVVSEFRRSRSGAQPHLPYGRLWACLTPAWNAVSSTTIRNCFAHVPTIPHEMKEVLRTPFTDEKDHGMEQLKEELMALYPDRAAAIAGQRDYGVLLYLKSCEGQGPNRDLIESIKIVAADPKYKAFFLPGVLDVEDDDDDDESESSDSDYAEERSREGSPTQRTYGLRTGERDATMLPSVFSSQESSDTHVELEESHEVIKQRLLNAAIKAQAMYENFVAHTDAFRASPVQASILKASSQVTDYLDLMEDVLSFDLGEEASIFISDHEE